MIKPAFKLRVGWTFDGKVPLVHVGFEWKGDDVGLWVLEELAVLLHDALATGGRHRETF